MMRSSSFLLLSFVVLTTARTYPEDCSGSLQGGGTCVPIKTCSSVIQMVKEAVKHGLDGNLSRKKSIVSDIRKRVCGEVKQKKICCADHLDEVLVETTTTVAEIEVVTESTETTIDIKEVTESVTVAAPVEKEPEALTFIGDFEVAIHEVGGKVFAKDHNSILIKGFTYDGAGPDAFLWAGNSSAPNSEALEDEFVNAVLPYPFSGVPAYKYDDKDIPILGAFPHPTDIELKLPEHVTVEDLHWISVWCRDFQVNFGQVTFPDNFRLN